MPELPPKELVATLEGLGLATAKQVAGMGRRVRRLSGNLPRFESVWIDALAQARLLTQFQAAELNSGRGRGLRVGPYLLCERLTYPLYAAGYRARHVETGEMVRLAVIQVAGEPATPRPSPLTPRPSSNFVAEPWVDGRTAAEWMVQYGRFPPEVVLEIARAMLVRLVELENRGVCHGDICASSLILSDRGEVVLPWPGLRGVVRPEEGYAHVDLPPEAFENLAPERIALGTPPTVPGDIFACGCLWWSMLCGRPALPGGNGLAKLRAAERSEIRDVREYAPDAPATLVAAISACVEREPKHRPESMARLSAVLGPPTRDGREKLIGALDRGGRPTVRWTTTARSIRRSNRTPLWLAGGVCCLAIAAAIFWPRGTRNEAFSSRRHVGQEHANKADVPSAAKQSTAELSNIGVVVPASYQQPAGPPADLVLRSDQPNDARRLRLREGERVRAPSGRRAVLLVPRGGLIVDKENVRFENIDFRWNGAAAGDRRENAEAALVRLQAGIAAFQGCRFLCADLNSAPVSAVRWVHPTDRKQAAVSLPNGRLAMADCLIAVSDAGVDCRTLGAVGVQLANVLHVGSGPLVRLDHCPRPDESISLSLAQSTLRGGPLLECFVADAKRQPGEISVLATASVFEPAPDVPLVQLQSVESPRLVPGCLRWTGQGSLVAPATPILGWRGPDDRQRFVDESTLSIAGLVRSEIVFAGPALSDAAASRAVRWQAPLQTADPPGIDPVRLPARKNSSRRP